MRLRLQFKPPSMPQAAWAAAYRSDAPACSRYRIGEPIFRNEPLSLCTPPFLHAATRVRTRCDGVLSRACAPSATIDLNSKASAGKRARHRENKEVAMPIDMTLTQAVDARISCRAYTDQRVEQEKLAALQTILDEANEREGLRMQLVVAPAGADAAILTKKLFASNVSSCIACVGADTALAREKIGYWGEKAVLHATRLGLSTCWIASTYDQKAFNCRIDDGEAIACIIALGYAPAQMPLKQKAIRTGLRAKTKKADAMVAGDVANMPAWTSAALDCVVAAPTAVNMHPVVFTWRDGMFSAAMPKQRSAVQDMDLGICKLHFALGSGQQGHWEWGQNGRFIIGQNAGI